MPNYDLDEQEQERLVKQAFSGERSWVVRLHQQPGFVAAEILVLTVMATILIMSGRYEGWESVLNFLESMIPAP